METRELKKLADEATGLMAEAAVKASRSLISASISALERHLLGTFSTLAGKLTIVHVTLQNPQPGQEERIFKRLPRFLKQLEAVCSWRAKSSPKFADSKLGTHPFPFLYALVHLSSQERHRAITELSSAITIFASGGGTEVRKFIRNLESFVPPKGTDPHLRQAQTSSEEILNELIESPVEYSANVNELLYTTLSQHFPCTCSFSDNEPGTPQEHWARLRLGTRVSVVQGDVLFDTLFSAAPASQCVRTTKWQQLRFQIPNQSKQSRSVRFAEEDVSAQDSQPNAERERYSIIKLGNFCALLRKYLGHVCIRLKIIDGHLHHLYNAGPASQRAVPAQSVSLSKVLECYRISSKGKIFLAYIIAKSVWRYYNSNFMKAPWTIESVHFMREKKYDINGVDREEIDPASPCFAFRPLVSEQAEPTEYFERFSVLHRYPRVLALGVLLVDICRKRAPDNTAKASSLEEQINSDFTRYSEIVRSSHWPDLDVRHGDAIRTYRDAVCKCLDPRLFHIPSSTKSPDQAGIQKRRNALYTYVVLPLEILCADFGIIDKTDDIGRLAYSEPSAELLSPPAPVVLATSGEPLNPSAAWLKRFMESPLANHIIQQFRANNSYSRVRIAILDTGYDAKSLFFSVVPRKKRLVGWKDFVDGQDEPVDCDGHGTHVLSLAMKIAPAADICVARIAKNTEDLQNAATNIEEAIKWATNLNEANADIVSMSFGFPEEPCVNGRTLIGNAIHRAIQNRNGQVLFFAAAANDGGNQREMFPARHDEVISVHATDHRGTFQGFNPPPNFLDVPIFGTLGKDVPGAWLNTQNDEVCKTGTSIATPIAAGIAATILGYVQLGISSNRFDNVPRMKKLWTKRGMYSAFMKLSRQMEERRFYLYPQDFLRETEEQGRDALLVDAVREV